MLRKKSPIDRICLTPRRPLGPWPAVIAAIAVALSGCGFVEKMKPKRISLAHLAATYAMDEVRAHVEFEGQRVQMNVVLGTKRIKRSGDAISRVSCPFDGRFHGMLTFRWPKEIAARPSGATIEVTCTVRGLQGGELQLDDCTAL